ncbi:MAG: 4-hydroxythreonine-4-phosphate dehydrogenase PdxA [Planctomycetota bacterium]
MTTEKEKTPVCRVILTMGDPAGVGPELCMKALQHVSSLPNVALTVVGSARILRWIGDQIGASLELDVQHQPATEPNTRVIIDYNNISPDVCVPPVPSPEGGRESLNYIRRGITEIQNGRADVLVTSPINKEAIAAAGSSYPGHTEMLGEITGTAHPVMLLLNDSLKVTFVTKHIAVNDISSNLNANDITHTATALGRCLTHDFGVESPRIGVCALNPHAGDGGRFGDEERHIIKPAVEETRQSGLQVDGPYPSDTLFVKAINGEFDGVVAMYHDQGMIPIKLSGLDHVVNTTLGLPFVRTSPGHGTAYDIAGKGVADPSSTFSAIRTATTMHRARCAQ